MLDRMLETFSEEEIAQALMEKTMLDIEKSRKFDKIVRVLKSHKATVEQIEKIVKEG